MIKFKRFIRIYALRIITALFWLGIIFYYFHYRSIHDYSDSEIIRKVYFFLKREGMFGGFIYISIYILRTVVFFPSSLVIMLSPSLFGLPLAILYTLIGENISAVFGYYLGKFFGKNIISEAYLDKFAFLKTRFRDNSFLSILTARLIFVPFDPLSYISGFFKAQFSGYFWGTLLGTLPGILVFLMIGAGIKNIEKFNLAHISVDKRYILVSVVLVIISLMIVYYLNQGQPKTNKKHQD